MTVPNFSLYTAPSADRKQVEYLYIGSKACRSVPGFLGHDDLHQNQTESVDVRRANSRLTPCRIALPDCALRQDHLMLLVNAF